ncbi:hypothetical protein [Leptothrix cholodnii]|nr:hypothetical protein [Leptothrix cholodnii]
MSATMRPPPDIVPTLTEVVGFSETAPVAADQASPAAGARGANVMPLNVVPLHSLEVDLPVDLSNDRCGPGAADGSLTVGAFPIDEDELTQRVLLDVQRQIDRMFEFRVRESVGPAFARLMESFIEQTRDELAATLRDVVRRAVAQELARHRSR